MSASSSQPACHDALFELGMEECPAPLLPQLAASLKAQMRAALDEAGFTLDAIQSYHTPRRLALLITQLAEQQPSRNVARKGPAVAQAFDEDGSPRPQALGFARSCGVSVEDLTHVDGRLFYESIEAGKTIQSVLPDLLAEALKRLPLPKTMRWGAGETRFIRPVHSLLLMYGPACVPCTLLGLDAGTDTFGHRFLAPHPLPLSAPSDYLRLLEEEGFVLADPEARMARIKTQLAACTPEGARMHCDEALLTEVNGLVEWPVAHVGTFDPAFLALPKEVLITSMQSHQRYFPVFKAANHAQQLDHRFAFISNIPSTEPSVVIEGNERVLSARLSDALFFFNKDKKTTLAERLPLLDHILFQRKLGSVGDKVRRLKHLVHIIETHLKATPRATTQQAAELCKCDLPTGMVDEFSDLQGTMGRYYAEAEGLDPTVAQAIESHLKPRFSGDSLPEQHEGIVLALADRIDTLVGIFGIGLAPTSEKDPYALRRAANGVLRLCVEHALDLSLEPVLRAAAAGYGDVLSEAHAHDQALRFIQDRMKAYLAEQGISTPCFQAVDALKSDHPRDISLRAQALHAFLKQPEAQALAQANKRVHNILKKQTTQPEHAVDAALFVTEEETNLHQALAHISARVEQASAQQDYTEALNALSELKAPIDAFFEHVMVLCDDAPLRANRLALLQTLRDAFLHVADMACCSPA